MDEPEFAFRSKALAMIEFLQITNDPQLAALCDTLPGMRLFVDLERNGKAQRQAGRNTFISAHTMEDVSRVAAAATKTRLMVRLNPVYEGTAAEVEEAIDRGAAILMLPMFSGSADLGAFCRQVAGRVPVVALLENADALHSIDQWIGTPGLAEVFLGLNDLHLSLRMAFMFEPLAAGMVDSVAARVRAEGLRFGFGGMARLDEGLLPGRVVMGEHLRIGSQAVILSRGFRAQVDEAGYIAEIKALRVAEAALTLRAASEIEQNRLYARQLIDDIAIKIRATAAPV